jgi:hypothetical protein
MPFKRMTKEVMEALSGEELIEIRNEIEAMFRILRDSDNPDQNKWRDLVDEINAIQWRLITLVGKTAENPNLSTMVSLSAKPKTP